MAKAQYLSGPQLVTVSKMAGFDDAAARTYAAIQLAESGGAFGNTTDLSAALAGSLPDGSYPGLANYPHGIFDPAGHQLSGPEISVGTGQINLLAHPDVDPIRAMNDPLYNAQQALKISAGGRNFGPWSTFTNGAYRAHMAQLDGPGGSTDAFGIPIPSSSPFAGATAGGSSSSSSSDDGNPCLLKFPGVGFGIGQFCVLSRSQGRAIVGALVLTAGGAIMLGGVALIAAYGLEGTVAKSVAKSVVKSAAGKIPDPGDRLARRAEAGPAPSSPPYQYAGGRRVIGRSSEPFPD